MDSKDLASLAQKLSRVFSRITGHSSGHVHFMYEEKADHLILVCHNGRTKQIIAKNRDCKKGECIEWIGSEFSNFSPEEAFLKFSDRIDRIIIDNSGIKKNWRTLDDFLNWLDTMLE